MTDPTHILENVLSQRDSATGVFFMLVAGAHLTINVKSHFRKLYYILYYIYTVYTVYV